MLAGVDEHNWMEQLCKVELLAFDSAALSLQHPGFYKQDFPAEATDPIRRILAFCPELLPLLREFSVDQFVDYLLDLSSHQSFSLQDVIQSVKLAIDAICEQECLRGLEVNEGLNGIL